MRQFYHIIISTICLVGFTTNIQAQDPFNCNPDEFPPVISTSFAGYSFKLPLGESLLLNRHILQLYISDTCNDPSEVTVALTLEENPDQAPQATELLLGAGVYTVYIHATDKAGNLRVLSRDVEVINDEGACDPDFQFPIALCRDRIIIESEEGENHTISLEDIDEGSLDLCTATEDLTYSLGLNNEQLDSNFTSLTLGDGYYDVTLRVTDLAGNRSVCRTVVAINTQNYVYANVFVDNNGDCIQDPEEEVIPYWFVTIASYVGGNRSMSAVVTDENGVLNYPLFSDDTLMDSIEFGLFNRSGISTGCPSFYRFTSPMDSVMEVDFGVQLVDDCDYLTVDIATNRVRPCFSTNYFVNYCNNSNHTVEDVEVVVDLDDGLILDAATIPYIDLGNNSFAFALGALDKLECGNIRLDVFVDCDMPVGTTACATATIEPYTCDDPGNAYNGPSLKVTGECDEENDLVKFSITNVGQGNMLESVEYVVVEDVVMYMKAPILLNSLESIDLPTLPANGATWQVSVPQPEGHPGLGYPVAFVEGCDGLNSGIINQFYQDEADPNISVFCREATNAYDPNDKQAFPRGYGSENFIEANTMIEYFIRFQNTGTDTAYNVIIQDQLDPSLDFNSLVVGAASHPYSFEQSDEGLVRFYFNLIMLPDSNVSEPNSHGFIQFEVAQKPDNPIGTVIENEAAIYFDFNEPIITNEVWHTIGEDFIISSNFEPFLEGINLWFYPNPMMEQAHANLRGWKAENARFSLFNGQGQLVKSQEFSGYELDFNRDGLAAGVYFFLIRQDGQFITRGKLIIQ